MRALLVEADDSTRTRLRGLLADAGWAPTVADTAEAALQSFEAEPSTLVVVGRPPAGADAIAFTRRLRALPRGEEACILVADTVAASQVGAFLNAGADDL